MDTTKPADTYEVCDKFGNRCMVEGYLVGLSNRLVFTEQPAHQHTGGNVTVVAEFAEWAWYRKLGAYVWRSCVMPCSPIAVHVSTLGGGPEDGQSCTEKAGKDA